MVLVTVPSVLLISEAVAESGGTWWPWALAGTIWALLTTVGSVLFWLRMTSRGHW